MSRLAILDTNGDPRFQGWQGTPPTNPDPDPPPPDPPAPGSFTHGSQIFRNNVGRPDGYYPGDTRTPLTSFSATFAGKTYTSADSGAVVNNAHFTNNVQVAAGVTSLTFKYCLFDGPQSDVGGKYLFTNQGTAVITFEDCSFAGRYGHGKTIYQQGAGGLKFKRCALMGSEDIIHFGPGSSRPANDQPFPSYSCQDFTGAALILEECWIGDGVRYASGHIDCIQFDTRDGIRVGNMVMTRCKAEAYSINSPAGPRASQGDPTNPANAVFIASHGATDGVHGYYGLYDCQIDGGNITVNAGDAPTPLIMAVRGCKVGRDTTFVHGGNTCMGGSRYGTGIAGTGGYRSDNTWLSTGTYVKMGNGGSIPATYNPVTAGDPVNL